MKTKILLAALIVGTLLFSCSKKNTLEQKKKELSELKQELVKLQSKIDKLEKEIAELDTTKKERTYPVKLATINLVPFEHKISIQGNVESDALIKITTEVPGKVIKVFVKEGQYVKKGQILFKIDARPLQEKLNELKARYELAKTMYEKQKRLWQDSIGAEVQYLQAKTQKEALESAIKSLQAQISKTYIKAPISGHIEDVFIKEGETAMPGFPLATILGPGKLKIRVSIPEAYLGSIKKGSKAQVYTPTQKFSSYVSNVEQTVNPMLKTFDVLIAVPKGIKLNPNSVVKVEIEDYSLPNAITVPINLIQKDEEGNYFVFVAEKDPQGKLRAKKRVVSIGKISGNNVEILSGLKAGDQIIIEGHKLISDGFLLKPVK